MFWKEWFPFRVPWCCKLYWVSFDGFAKLLPRYPSKVLVLVQKCQRCSAYRVSRSRGCTKSFEEMKPRSVSEFQSLWRQLFGPGNRWLASESLRAATACGDKEDRYLRSFRGCTYYAVQMCDSGRRNDCGVRSLRRGPIEVEGRSFSRKP